MPQGCLLTKWTLLVTTLSICLHLRETQGQSCLNRFLSNTDIIEEGEACTDNSCKLNNREFVTRLIPDINFTCSGRITQWRAAGELPSRNSDENDDTKLRIWRRVENNPPGFYSRTQHTIALGVCNNGQTAADTVATNVYECELASDSQVPVEPGDIVGLDIPRSTRRVFTPYFTTTGVGPKNYDFVNLDVSGVVSLHDPNVTTMQTQPLIFLRVTFVATETTTSGNDLTLATTESPVFTDITTDQDLHVQPTRTLLPVTIEIGREKTAVSFSPKHTASVSYHDVANNATMVDNDGTFAFRVSVMTVAVFAGLVLMAAIIVILTLALVCSLRKNRKLKREMTKKGHSTRSLGDNINSSMEMILNDSTGVGHVILNDSTGSDHVTSTIPMEENIAYNKQRRSSGYEYVINELVYASVEQCDRLPEDSPASNTYLDILGDNISPPNTLYS